MAQVETGQPVVTGRAQYAVPVAFVIMVGLLLIAPRGNLLRFMPALNVTAEEIDTMLAQLDGLIAQVRKA